VSSPQTGGTAADQEDRKEHQLNVIVEEVASVTESNNLL